MGQDTEMQHGRIADENSIEILSRAKRIETKLSKLMELQGFGTYAGDVPVWQDGAVKIPSMEVSLKQIIEAIPTAYDGQVLVVHQRKTIAFLRKAT